jgi:hypothetical protein
MTLKLVYIDLTEWDGTPEEYQASPVKDVLILWVYPCEDQKVQVSGWDHYGVSVLSDGIRVARWKDVESYERDGMTLDLAAGLGAYTTWTHEGEMLESTDYMPYEELPPCDAVRHGRWVDDDVAREAGIL